MNLDELRSVQSGERQAASLQNLRATFYEDAGAFIQQLQAERDRAAERADDPFASPEVRKLTDDIETARSTVEAIYERRVGKVVKMASIAAADMPTDEENLTNEERDLFESLVKHIEDNRELVLDGVLEGEGSDLSCSRTLDMEADSATPDAPTRADTSAKSEPAADPPPSADQPPDGISAADVMGGNDAESDVPGSDLSRASGSDTPTTPPVTDQGMSTEPPAEQNPAPLAAGGATAEANDDSDTEPHGGKESIERTMVRITDDIGEIFGADERSYDLSAEDVVTLPAANADPLVEKGAAERLD